MRFSLLYSTFFFAVLLATDTSGKTVPETTFHPDREVGYKPVKTALRALVVSESARGAQHFCVVGYRVQGASDAPPKRTAWVYWREQKRLIQWQPATEGFESKQTLLRSSRSLDLAKDVVATEAEAGSSTYLVSRAWVDGVLKDCKARGTQHSISAK
jgi:hypothetical protein